MVSSRKKQRVSAVDHSDDVQALGSQSSRNRKQKQPTQEELDLTASLFGSARASLTSESDHKSGIKERDAGVQELSDEEETGLDDVEDDQLFAIDTGADTLQGYGSEGDSSSSGGSSDPDSDSDADDVEPSPATTSQPPRRRPDAEPTSGKSKAVWTDPSTATLLIPLVGPNARAPDGSFAGTKRLRKLRESKDETQITGREYERRLREYYQKLHPRPAWANRTVAAAAASTETSDAAEPSASSSSQDFSVTNQSMGPTLSDLLSRDTGLVARVTGHKSSKSPLPQGEIQVERLRDANHGLDENLASAIESMEFHPSPKSRILMTASRDRRVRLFQIDGSANPLLQTLHVPSLPLSTATFHPGGTSMLLSGPRPYFYSYDLQSGRVLRSSPWRSAGPSALEEDIKERDLSRAKFQPLDSSGQSRLLAIGGRRGAIHLVDWATCGGGGGGSLISSLRQNSALAGLDWDHSAEAQGRRLVSLSQEGTVSLWDIRNMRCEVIKRDVGLFGAQGISVSPTSSFTAIGSESGIVNMYDSTRLSLSASTSSQRNPILSAAPREDSMETNKSIGNLTTATTTMKYNHDGQILALASRNKKDALRMVHLPSLTVFSNWPTSGTPLGQVTDIAFSTNGSQYVAIGNTRGRVLLYGLKHFSN